MTVFAKARCRPGSRCSVRAKRCRSLRSHFDRRRAAVLALLCSAGFSVPGYGTPAAMIAKAREDAETIKLPEGGEVDGVRRDPVRVVGPGASTDEGSVAVTPDGEVFVVAVHRASGGESLILRKAPAPAAPLGPALRVGFALHSGTRAWHPALAVGPAGAVWMAWCGTRHAHRGRHRREIFLQRISGSVGPIRRVSKGLKTKTGRHCDPSIAVDLHGVLQLVWEADGRIGARAYSRAGTRPLGPPRFVSQGPWDRRPVVLAGAARTVVVWDRFVPPARRGVLYPHYELWARPKTENEFGEAVQLRGGLGAAPALARLPGGGLAIAWHTLGKWQTKRLRVARLEEGAKLGPVRGLSWPPQTEREDPEPRTQMQGELYPALQFLKDGSLVAVTRVSQGLHLHRLDASGWHPVLDLTRRGWGARGRRSTLVRAPDNSLLLLRRARHNTVLERLQFTQPAGAPAFAQRSAKVEPANERGPAPQRFVPPAWTGAQALLFGDVHMHSAISDATDPPDEVLATAYVRGEDFAVLTDHDYVVGSRMALSEHDEIAWLSDRFNALEGFTTLHAYEWTTPPLPGGFGHRIVYFRGQPPTQIYGYKEFAPTTTALNAHLRKERAFTAPHHTAWTGTDWEGADPKIQRHFEIVSTHGVFEAKGATPIPARGDKVGMFAVDGLRRGLRFGFLGGSDGHGLRWHHGIARRADTWSLGLTGALVKREGRAALWDALYARHSLATTGVRAAAYLGLQGKIQGDALRARGPLVFRAQLQGVPDGARVSFVRDGVPLSEAMLPKGVAKTPQSRSLSFKD